MAAICSSYGTYGVEGVHWSTAAEEVCGVKYEEGQFHMLENREKEGTVYTKNHIDPMLAVAPLENDPKAEAVAEEAKVLQRLSRSTARWLSWLFLLMRWQSITVI